jgi:di/tricarboxylate transporter
MLGLGTAMETTGTSALIASPIAHLGSLNLSPQLSNLILLASLYLITTILTEVLSNNATVVLMTPIAIQMAITLGVDPRPLIIATCIASSASFSTPIGYQTNTYVYSVGGYRFSDFLKIGIPLNILYFIGTVVIVPLVWSF